uniref:uncharacterized protein LOC105353097 n=1 Tax=Fragaria vesca subsp. vesca TaxID=101020 RepID=UPI0005CA5152|nr:PREDICTED: uncharacterized protein LOC105353097 [Fragaria vesca subsp. vesca]
MGRNRSRAGGGGGSLTRRGRSLNYRSAGYGLSTSQQQEALIKNSPNPGAAYIVHGSQISQGNRYPYDQCERFLNYLYDVTRLCGSDCHLAHAYRDSTRIFCGIDVLTDHELEKKKKKATDAAAAAHL